MIRHAAAAHERPGQGSDFDRALSPKGEREAALMASRLCEQGFAPDRIVTSSARRTSQTADVIAQRIGHPLERIERSDDLYLASGSRLAECIAGSDDRVHHLALVGHNPGLSILWDWLTDDRGQRLPTCGVARLALTIGRWLDLSPGCARLIDFDHPDRDWR